MLPTYDHHGTTCECHLFGNRLVYKNDDDITIGLYVNKTSKVNGRQLIIKQNVKEANKSIASLIHGGVDELTRILPKTSLMLAPIII